MRLRLVLPAPVGAGGGGKGIDNELEVNNQRPKDKAQAEATGAVQLEAEGDGRMNNNELTITGIDGRAVDLLDLVDNSAVMPVGNLFIVHPSIMCNGPELYAITYLWTITHLPTGGAIGYAPDPVIAIKMARTIDDELGQEFDFADPNNVPEGLSKRAKIIRRRILAEYNEHWSI